MYRTVDEMFHRFGQTTGHRPVFAVVTTEGFESTQNINPQEIKHISDHFISRGGTPAQHQADRAAGGPDVPWRRL